VILQTDLVLRVLSTTTREEISRIELAEYVNITVSDVDKKADSSCKETTEFCSSLVGKQIYMQPIDGSDQIGLSILNSKGDVYIINFKFENAEPAVQEVEKPINETNETNKTNRTKRKKKGSAPVRIPKTISFQSVETFNMWDVANQSSDPSTTIATDRNITSNVPISLEVFGRGMNGNYIIVDNTGYIYIYRRAIQENKQNNTESINEFKLISNAHSGFENIEVISRHQSFQILSQGSTMGFLRAMDGQVAKSSCEVGNHKIISIAHDNYIHGRFYVGINTGDIIVFTLTAEKQKIGCNIEGKIAGDELTSDTDKNHYK
jgi:hypothetical protein